MKTRIKNARIITGTGEALEQADILFDETGILEIGDTFGDADREIDGTGKTVLPGFIDCHIHPAALTSEDEMTVACKTYHGVQELLRSGITTTRTVGTRYGADIVLRNLINEGVMDGPRILASGEVICITCGHGSEVGIECDTVGETLKAVRGLCKKRVDWIKLMPTSGVIGIGPATEVQLSKEQIEAAVSVGRAFATPTCAHLMNYNALRLCVEAGITSVEHGYDMDEAIADQMIEKGTWYIPTGVVTLMEMTYIKPVNQYEKEMVQKAAAAQEKVRTAMKVAVRRGVKMAVGTDTGCPFTNPAMYAFATELYLYSIAGMSNMDILTAATLNGAKMLGIDQETGSLECGKQADICVLEGNPLEDIQAARNVQYTFRNGKLLYHLM